MPSRSSAPSRVFTGVAAARAAPAPRGAGRARGAAARRRRSGAAAGALVGLRGARRAKGRAGAEARESTRGARTAAPRAPRARRTAGRRACCAAPLLLRSRCVRAACACASGRVCVAGFSPVCSPHSGARGAKRRAGAKRCVLSVLSDLLLTSAVCSNATVPCGVCGRPRRSRQAQGAASLGARPSRSCMRRAPLHASCEVANDDPCAFRTATLQHAAHRPAVGA